MIPLGLCPFLGGHPFANSFANVGLHERYLRIITTVACYMGLGSSGLGVWGFGVQDVEFRIWGLGVPQGGGSLNHPLRNLGFRV